MDQGNFEEQLSMVQQMVQEMKQGFTTAMEELSKIQYGDQTLQKQLADTKQECKEDIKDIQQAVKDIKLEVQKIAAQVREVTTAQKDLRERVESYQDDKTVLLDELEKSGIISSDTRMRLQMRLSADQHIEDNPVPKVTTMVNTYLDSIQPHTGEEDQYQSDSSLTATVSRNMGLTQALGEKCLHLDLSASSEEEEGEEQEPPQFSPHPDVHRQGNFHREEVAHDIVEAERDYCSQLWTLMDTFINPLRQGEILTPRELNRVFPPYMPQLYEQHCIMLHKLEDRLAKWKWNGIVGDVFAKLTDSQDSDSGIALYRLYINDFPTIINSMNRWFAQSTHFREIMQSTCMATSPVLTLLLAPLHQVPKYSLLIKSMLKWTSADHPDRYYLEMALSRLKLFLKNMNDELEHAMQVLNIGSSNDGDGPSHRSHELGNSQSSGSSSIEANPASTTKDSGIQSNGEDVLRGHLSPTFNQRYLQQTLRERQQALDAEHIYRKESNLVQPRPHHLAYGSQPNLSEPLIVFDTGRSSPYMFSNPNKKLYSSQTKLHLPFDRSEKAKLRKRSDGQKLGPHSSHVRPLTPQILSYTRNRNFSDGRVHLREGGSGRGHQRPASAVEFTGVDFERQQKIIELLAYQNALTPRQSSSHDRRKSDFYMSVPKYLGAYTSESREDGTQEEHPVQGRGRSSHKQFLAVKEKILYQGSDGIHEDEKGDGSYFRNHSGKRGHHVPKTQSMEDYGIYGDDDNDAEEEDEADEYKQIPAMNVMSVPHRPKIMVPRWRQNSPSYMASADLDKQPKGSSQEHLVTSLAQILINPGPKNNVKGRVSPIIHTGNASSKQTQEKDRNSANVEPSGDHDIKLKQVTDITKQGETESPSGDKRSEDSEKHPFMVTQQEKGNDNNLETHETISVSHSHFKENHHHGNSANSLKQSVNIPDTNEKLDNRAQAILDGSQSYRRAEINSTIDNKFLKVSSVSASQTHHIVPEASDLKEDRSAVKPAQRDWGSLMPKDGHGPKLLTATPEVSDRVQKTQSEPKSGRDDKHSTQTQNLIEYFQNRRFTGAVSTERDSSVEGKVSHSVYRSSTPNPVFDKNGIDIINLEMIGNDDRNGDNNATLTKQTTLSEGQASANHKIESEGQNSKGQKKGKTDSDDSIIVSEVIEEGVTQNGHSHKKQLSLVSFSKPGEPLGNRGISNLKKLEETKDSVKKDFETKDMANNKTSGQSVIKPSVNFAKLQRTTSPTPLGKISQPVGPVKIPVTQEKANNSMQNINGNSNGAEIGDSSRRAQSAHQHEKPVEIENRMSSLLKETDEITNSSRARRSPSPNKGSGERSLSPSKGNLKDTKIPVRKKDSSPGITVPNQSNVSKSTEDISKIKKKSAFKDSIKNLFGRKKHGTSEEEAAMHKPGEADQYL
ncbi:hypothetical protein CHS0354_014589 [Potamilus streckersoni]|uniref:DH domain-containing protein n=1 Tax=Potamilus streckersoni TaxID=2493646 RepID=A0AAE0RP76_9BIVA|nr:hypothetical protein CHS0354_014589 [Potamilus streckersoni]